MTGEALDFTLDGREVGLYFIEPSDYFAELCLIDEGAQPEFVISLERSQVLLLPNPVMRPLLSAHPDLSANISRRLAARVRQQILQRQVLALTNPLQRIAAQLQILLPPGTTNIQVQVRAPTHQELAIMVNLTRETVTRTFQLLHSQGILTRLGDELVVDRLKLGELTKEKSK